jgi:hypothetical protein
LQNEVPRLLHLSRVLDQAEAGQDDVDDVGGEVFTRLPAADLAQQPLHVADGQEDADRAVGQDLEAGFRALASLPEVSLERLDGDALVLGQAGVTCRGWMEMRPRDSTGTARRRDSAAVTAEPLRLVEPNRLRERGCRLTAR